MADRLDYELTEIELIGDIHSFKQQNESSAGNPGSPLLDQKPEEITTSQQVTPDAQTECILWKPVRLIQRRHGLVLAVLTPCFFSAQSVCIDVLTETIDSFQVVFMSVPIMVFCCFVVLLWTRVHPPSCSDSKHYLWLLVSSLCQTFNTCIFALVLSYLTVGDAVTIAYTAVIQVGLFSWLILKEPMRLFDLFFALLAFAGVIFIARPPFIFGINEDQGASKFNLLGVMLAFSVSCSGALLIIFNRKLSLLGVHSFFCLFFSSLVVFITSGIVCLILNRWKCPNLHEWLIALVAGTVYFFGYVVLFFALKAEKATLVTVIFTMEIVLAFLWQIFLLGILPPWTSYIGASLVLAACIGITLKNKPPSSDDQGTNENDAKVHDPGVSGK
ncbi:Solute carrier family 35 member G1 [Holothuria leucospilota]|uniref:Solute carrier family 35 member G1 n=1 Tax=Holothuria leucospilota TaxID=206669 RepID=A0A9Q1CTS9_HOLLE|nr:Solute carrier family 35 member G1 [Holothuria leucospilota]